MSIDADIDTQSTVTRSRRPRWLIVGAGSFGTAFAHVMCDRAVSVTIAARTPEQAERLETTRANSHYLPDYLIPHDLAVTTIDAAANEPWDVVVLAVPARAVVDNAERFTDQTDAFLSLAKGLLADGRRISEGLIDLVGRERYAMLTGPNIAREIVDDLPTASVLATHDDALGERLQQSISGLGFRVYRNDDLIGAELAGACKNVVAIAGGICQAAGFGTNGTSAIVTRGMCEVARLGSRMGARTETFLGLAGLGDLLTTIGSGHSRNRRAGELIAQGVAPAEVEDRIGQTVEGLRSAEVVARMAREHDVDMNICTAIADLAGPNGDLHEALRRLMARTPAREFPAEAFV